MNNRERGRRRRKRKRGDSWHAMREERRRRWKGRLDPRERDAFRHPPFPPQRRARFWREFFHDFTGSWPEDHWALAGRRFTPWHQGRDEYNPFVAALLSKGGGLLPLYVMHLLRETPRYGNEIMECITESTSRQWVANPGAIYPLMTMLEERGLARGEWEDPTKRTIRVYQLTEKGRQEMARLGAIMHPKLLEAIELLTKLAGELSESEAGYSDST